MKSMTPKEVIKLLQNNGWEETSQKGSHKKFVKNGKSIIIPYHTTDLAPGLLIAILKQAGLQ